MSKRGKRKILAELREAERLVRVFQDYAAGTHSRLGLTVDTPCETVEDGNEALRLQRINAGTRPGKSYILHRCDNRLCVRADHLFWGSPSDNARDCVLKGRHRGKAPTELECAAKIAALGKRIVKLLNELHSRSGR